MTGLMALLNVAVGLAFVFLVISMFASQLNEILARFLNWRPKDLKRGLQNLLQDPHFDGLANRLLHHPLVATVGADKTPSYIAPNSFALAILDIVRSKNPYGAVPIHEGIQALIDHYGGNEPQLIAGLEKWFNDSMDRVSGTYKRRAQIANFFFALIIAVLLNVDATKVGTALYADPLLSEKVDIIQSALETMPLPAGASATSPVEPSPVCVKDEAGNPVCLSPEVLRDKLAGLGLPIGWPYTDPPPQGMVSWTYFRAILAMVCAEIQRHPGIIVGWLITALAGSLGSQFWFDSLGKLLKMRSAGPKPKQTEGGST
ncbi:MAG: hypothetical protein ABWY00_01705 [Dongiaceae bacterium]